MAAGSITQPGRPRVGDPYSKPVTSLRISLAKVDAMLYIIHLLAFFTDNVHIINNLKLHIILLPKPTFTPFAQCLTKKLYLVTGVKPLCSVPRELVNYGPADSWCTTIVFNNPSHSGSFVPTLSKKFAVEFYSCSARQFLYMIAACSVCFYAILTDLSVLHGIFYSPVIYVSFRVFI
jgi:hypothetical protein